MIGFTKTKGASILRAAKTATAFRRAGAFSAARSFLESPMSNCVQTNAGPHTDRRLSKIVSVAACLLGLSRTFRVGSVHTPAKARRKQQGESASLWLRQRQGMRSDRLHMRLTQDALSGRTSASNVGLRERWKARTLTMPARLMFGGYADHAMCGGIPLSQKAAVFRSQYEFTGQQATLESTGQTLDDLKAERCKAAA
jgi:hypothetical protein